MTAGPDAAGALLEYYQPQRTGSRPWKLELAEGGAMFVATPPYEMSMDLWTSLTKVIWPNEVATFFGLSCGIMQQPSMWAAIDLLERLLAQRIEQARAEADDGAGRLTRVEKLNQ